MVYEVNVDTKELIEDVDASKWDVVNEEETLIFYNYIVDQPAVIEDKLIAEYPNGGKDYMPVVVTPERGHFRVTYENNSPFPYPIEVPEGISKDEPVPDIVYIRYWKKVSEEELARREEERKRQEEAAAEAEEKAKKQQEFLDNAPEQIDDIILLLADMVGGAV